ncbi:HET-domain-containing protein [Microthyrium microscopicum]|uniref:HET-domain-containing protein n=1 Tax=Microthyrium microscopicum TaxID=703497 RepID=A0A6A6TYS9_9PEZI|nr:HET-domain-containing protein [Microthyrium microscopicum]
MHLLDYHHGRANLCTYEEKDRPPYAILSHTWGDDDDEVTYRDVKDGTGKKKPGYDKISFCAQQASIDNLEFFWIDTCCIQKENLVELSEAITSMFRWYQEAKVCYVSLTDVEYGSDKGHAKRGQPWEKAFLRSRWFTRGWTLQELIAPSTVQFFSVEGILLGDRHSLSDLICEATGLPVGILKGGSLSDYDPIHKFQWVGTRRTRRGEDMAYSLMGIMGVSLPMNYGEGREHANERHDRDTKDKQQSNEYGLISRAHSIS